MIFLQVFFFHNAKLFSSQSFLNHICLYYKILVKKALYISLFISGFGFLKTFCSCHRVPGVSTFILAFWLSGYTLGFGFCMHMHVITSAFHSIHHHTIPPFSILAISPSPPSSLLWVHIRVWFLYAHTSNTFLLSTQYITMQFHYFQFLSSSSHPLSFPSLGTYWGLVFICRCKQYLLLSTQYITIQFHHFQFLPFPLSPPSSLLWVHIRVWFLYADASNTFFFPLNISPYNSTIFNACHFPFSPPSLGTL